VNAWIGRRFLPGKEQSPKDPSLDARFAKDPYAFLDAAAVVDGTVQTGAAEVSIADPYAVREILVNAEGTYQEDSMFVTRGGLYGPRAAQLALRRDVRALLKNHMMTQPLDALPAAIDSEVPTVSQWPESGVLAAYRYWRPILLKNGTSPRLQALLDLIIERTLLIEPSTQATWRRRLMQFRATFHLGREIMARQARPLAEEPRDLLDVVARAAGLDCPVGAQVELYLALLLSAVGSIGYLLGWSVYLQASCPEQVVPAEWVVREALRLHPIAWRLARKPTQASSIQNVVACPYLVQRNAQYWENPAAYHPERWAAPAALKNPAFVAFGYGPHACIAADLSIDLVARMLTVLSQCRQLIIRNQSPVKALAAQRPPDFILERVS
jgi:Cytochrome P450